MTEHYTSWRKSRHSEPNGNCVEVARATADAGAGTLRPETRHAIPRPTYAKAADPLPRQA